MEEKAGKVFRTAEEAGWTISEEYGKKLDQMFADFNTDRNAMLPESTTGLRGRFGGDDLAGTEYEGWTSDSD
ncbi:hypothetical protein D5S18_10180 [Nocardia panacis]|uniref:Uncharacterized protein n=1 Tax=Nocardia panacis TaxID=2340916 RepID=A0A3A4JZ38_9NOCA|nr:hypothetical protein [Nocardia panacis]RJO76635.1 hypothetical protein D5S18_10180 [Nocardia panacis]